MNDEIKNIMQSIVKGIVRKPERVESRIVEEFDARTREEIITIFIKVAEADIGVTIGSGGVTAEALRHIARLIGFQQTGKRFCLKIDTPKISEKSYHKSK